MTWSTTPGVEGDHACLVKEPSGERGKQGDTFLTDKGETITPSLTITEGENGKVEVSENVVTLLLWVNSAGENILMVAHMT
jgi:hypothetical protein